MRPTALPQLQSLPAVLTSHTPLPQETDPRSMNSPSTLTMSGPPESPMQDEAPSPPAHCILSVYLPKIGLTSGLPQYPTQVSKEFNGRSTLCKLSGITIGFPEASC